MSTEVWSPLLPAATVGVSRAPLALPTLPDPLAAVLAAFEPLPAAERLLKSAAVLEICAQAGVAFPPAPPLLAPAPAESQPALSGAAADVLRVMLEELPPRVAAPALAAAGRAGFRLPPTLLSLALEQRRSRSALTPGIDVLLGETGRWLLACRGEAAPAAVDADPAEVWQTGTLAERRVALATLLRSDRDAAREQFRAALPQLPAAERSELLGVLVDTADAADEPLFESLLKDRSREVRQLAAAGLQQLPDSGWAGRMCERVAALLSGEGKSLLLTPPTDADPAWAADGIEVKKPKHEALGERAWWLYELARRVPLSVWQTLTGLDAAGLLGWAKAGDWKEVLRRAWAESLAVSPALDALIAFGRAGMRPWLHAAMFARLSAEQTEAFWLAMLEGRKPPLVDLLDSYEQTLPIAQTLPPTLGAALLEVYASALAAERREHWHLAQLALRLSVLLPTTQLQRLRALPGLDTLDAESTLRNLDRNLTLRLRYAAALAA